jgi:hypothetical protein
MCYMRVTTCYVLAGGDDVQNRMSSADACSFKTSLWLNALLCKDAECRYTVLLLTPDA